jgi:hypothetical protein
MNLDQTMNIMIAIACAGVAWACLCRMDKMHATTKPLFRIKYTLLASGSIAGALSPWMFPEVPRLGGLVFVLSVFAFLLMGATAWREHAPDYSESDRAPLGPPEL